jgi:hypothetical protein
LSGASDLKFLGRNHSVDEALAAIGRARDIFPGRYSFGVFWAGICLAASAELLNVCMYGR